MDDDWGYPHFRKPPLGSKCHDGNAFWMPLMPRQVFNNDMDRLPVGDDLRPREFPLWHLFAGEMGVSKGVSQKFLGMVFMRNIPLKNG